MIRVRLHYLQQQLVRDAFRFKFENTAQGSSFYFESESLKDYISTLRDYDYIKERALKGPTQDPCIITSDKSHDRILLQETMQWWKTDCHKWDIDGKHEEAINSLAYAMDSLDEPTDAKEWKLLGGSRTAMNKKEAVERFLQRVGMAFIGGAFLIGPMLLMVLHQSRVTTLVTTSVCVFTFGLVMSVYLEKPFDVLSATAAYAAVLVVFVGTSTGNTSI